MEHLYDYNLFLEARLEDVLKCDNIEVNKFRSGSFDDNLNFIKYLKLKYKGDYIRFKIIYNDTINHNLKNRIRNRTNLNGINEFNILIKKSLLELFNDNYDKIKKGGGYILYLLEYNFNIIINIDYDKKKIRVKTIISGEATDNTKNTINIKSTLL